MADSENTTVPPGLVTSNDIIDLVVPLFKADALCRMLYLYATKIEDDESSCDIKYAIEMIGEKIKTTVNMINILEGRAIQAGVAQEVAHG